jgi:hypothetical protein
VKACALSGITQDRTIVRVCHEADPQTADVEVFAAMNNASKMLCPNLPCRVVVTLPEAKNTPTRASKTSETVRRMAWSEFQFSGVTPVSLPPQQQNVASVSLA